MEEMPHGCAAGFVLAGGWSSRMGTDKALALFAGAPLIRAALDIFAVAGLTARIAGARSPLAAFAEEIADTFPEAGPLGGIHAGLSASEAEWNLFLPVDMPLMPSSLLRCLLERVALTGSPVTATRLNGRLEPFPVVLHRNVLRLVTQRLKGGDASCHRAWLAIPAELGADLDVVSVESLVQCGQCCHSASLPPVLWYRSANTPDELVQINRIYAKTTYTACGLAQVS
jgi:molybdopterin-guanine dinucleotide biosynthesis protein A